MSKLERTQFFLLFISILNHSIILFLKFISISNGIFFVEKIQNFGIEILRKRKALAEWKYRDYAKILNDIFYTFEWPRLKTMCKNEEQNIENLLTKGNFF